MGSGYFSVATWLNSAHLLERVDLSKRSDNGGWGILSRVRSTADAEVGCVRRVQCGASSGGRATVAY